MKKAICILLAALCALLPLGAMAAQTTTVKTTVPNVHTITVICGTGGGVSIADQTLTGSFAVQVPRLSTLEITVLPEENYAFSTLNADDSTGLTVDTDSITLANIFRDNKLELTFAYTAPDATPTPVPTATPTPEPTATLKPDGSTPEPTATPTIPVVVVTPTPTPTLKPDGSTPEPTATPTPAPTATLKPDGSTPEPTATPTSPVIIVTPSPKPTATATATPTPVPTATLKPDGSTPEPTATPTPAPTATLKPDGSTPEPTATPTSPVIIITPSPEPTATATAEPTVTPTAAPTAKPTAKPAATAEPTATPTPAPTAEPTVTPEPTKVPTVADTVILPEVELTGDKLYDEVLGDGNGLSDLHLVFNEDYQPEDYEILPQIIDDEVQGNSMLVCALPDENGHAAHRSMLISASQLARTMQSHETDHLVFENAEIMAVVDTVDLLGNNLPKLMQQLVAGAEIAPEILEQDWDSMEPAELTASQLAKIDIEIRLEPETTEDGLTGYRLAALLHWDEQTLDVSKLIPSLTVCLTVDHLVTEENFAEFEQLYTVMFRSDDAESGESVALSSKLRMIPDELPEHQNDKDGEAPEEKEKSNNGNHYGQLKGDNGNHFGSDKGNKNGKEDKKDNPSKKTSGYKVNVSDHEEDVARTYYDPHIEIHSYRHYALTADYAGAGIYWVQAK